MAVPLHLIKGRSKGAEHVEIAIRGMAKSTRSETSGNGCYPFPSIDSDDAGIGFLGNIEIIMVVANEIDRVVQAGSEIVADGEAIRGHFLDFIGTEVGDEQVAVLVKRQARGLTRHTGCGKWIGEIPGGAVRADLHDLILARQSDIDISRRVTLHTNRTS